MRNRRLSWRVGAGCTTALLVGACALDFDRYDPSLAEPSVGSGAATGSGGDASTGGGATGSTASSSTGGSSASSSGQGGATACQPGATVSCYNGDPATKDVGACRSGLATCTPDGSGFGACENEVLPITEDCGTQADDDCDGVANESDAGCSCVPYESQACYAGPGGTEGVGVCRGGISYCAPDGTGFGACVGEVLPLAAEDCASPVDDDCDTVTNDHCAGWSKRFRGFGVDNPYALAIDAGDNVLIAGAGTGGLDFGGGVLGYAGGGDVFVVKLNSAGTHQWSRMYGDALGQEANGIGTDSSGNVYVAGLLRGTVAFGALTPLVTAAETDVFVVKLDSAGVEQWAVSFSGTGGVFVEGSHTNAAGETFVTGGFEGSIDFGAGAVAANGTDGYLAKLDTNGALLWVNTFGGAGDDEGEWVETDGTSVLLTGWFTNTATIAPGGVALNSGGGQDAFIAKLNADGTEAWSKRFGAGSNQKGESIAPDGAGNVLATGGFFQGIDLGGGNLASDGGQDVWLAKFDTNGNHVFSRGYGGTDAGDSMVNVAVDSGGDVLSTFDLNATDDVGAGPMVGAGSDDVLLLRLASNGDFVRVRRFGDQADQDPRAVRVDSNDNVVIIVSCDGNVDFGNGLLGTADETDICVASFPP
jgi:hypothetical protein